MILKICYVILDKPIEIRLIVLLLRDNKMFDGDIKYADLGSSFGITKFEINRRMRQVENGTETPAGFVENAITAWVGKEAKNATLAKLCEIFRSNALDKYAEILLDTYVEKDTHDDSRPPPNREAEVDGCFGRKRKISPVPLQMRLDDVIKPSKRYEHKVHFL